MEGLFSVRSSTFPRSNQNIEHGAGGTLRLVPCAFDRELGQGSGSDPSLDDDDAPITALSWSSSSRGSSVHVIDIKYCVP
jgi:hypothetical protein